MEQPVAMARHMRDARVSNGVWMILEPQTGDRIGENLSTVSRACDAFVTVLYNPTAQGGDVARDAQAGAVRLREVLTAAGLPGIRRAAKTSLLMLEGRP